MKRLRYLKLYETFNDEDDLEELPTDEINEFFQPDISWDTENHVQYNKLSDESKEWINNLSTFKIRSMDKYSRPTLNFPEELVDDIGTHQYPSIEDQPDVPTRIEMLNNQFFILKIGNRYFVINNEGYMYARYFFEIYF